MKKFLFPGIVFTLFVVLAFFFLWWNSGLKPADPNSTREILFTVEKGESVGSIALGLKSQDLIKDPLRFKLFVLFTGVSKKFKSGNFQLSQAQSSQEIIEVLIKGVKDQKVTIIEGLRGEQIGELLLKRGFPIDQKAWQKEIISQKLEGQLFPDTYSFPPGATQGAILATLKQNFEKKVTKGLSKEITESKLSLNEILTLASMVEREASDEQDRKIIAGILLKRWQKGWPLQIDATVQYAVASAKLKTLGQFSANFEWWPKNLTSQDLQIVSPYNTYTHSALPPGPICNPGLSAITAVLEPTDSPYWYYLNDAERIIHYAKTDEEQAQNINKYLR